MGGGSSKQLNQMMGRGDVKGSGTSSKLITASASCGSYGIKEWKMWRRNRQARKGGLKLASPDEPSEPANAPPGLCVHSQLLPVWWFYVQLIRQLAEFYFLVDFFAATWGVLVTVNKDLEH